VATHSCLSPVGKPYRWWLPTSSPSVSGPFFWFAQALPGEDRTPHRPLRPLHLVRCDQPFRTPGFPVRVSSASSCTNPIARPPLDGLADTPDQQRAPTPKLQGVLARHIPRGYRTQPLPGKGQKDPTAPPADMNGPCALPPGPHPFQEE
jgi:hypothetical protein